MRWAPVILAVLLLFGFDGYASAQQSEMTVERLTASYAPDADGSATRAVRGMVFPNSGSGGFHIGVDGLAQSSGNWTPSTVPHGLIGVTGHGISDVPDGRAWGGNFTARVLDGHTGGIASGVEINLDTRVPVQNRYGLTVAASNTGTEGAWGQEAMIRLTGKTGGAPWKDGILINRCCSEFPIRTDGSLMRTEGSGTVARGIDISSVDITGPALATPNGFEVSGAGYVELSAISTQPAPPAGKVRLYLDHNGQLIARFPTGALQVLAAQP